MAEYTRAAYISMFALLAIVAFRQWRARGERPSAWAAAAFGAVAVSTAVLSIPEDSSAELVRWTEKLGIGLLLLFPYLLLRFTTSFTQAPRRLDLAAVVPALLIAWNLTVPEIPSGERPSWLLPFIVAVLTYWVAFSGYAATRMWRAGRGLPTVARRRMRLMSVATVVMTFGILLAGLWPSDAGSIAFRLFNLLAAAVFLLGLTPPETLRLVWRRREQEEFRRATSSLMAAKSSREAAENLLPYVARVVGAQGVALLDSDAELLACHGVDQERLEQIREHIAAAERDAKQIRLGDLLCRRESFGWMAIIVTPYTPFFGGEELALLDAMGNLLHLALERSAAMEEANRELRRADELKSEFLAMASHELRTPLTAITGFTSTMLNMGDRIGEHEKQKFLHIIDAQSRRLSRLVEDLLTLSRIEAGMLQTQPVATPVSLVIKQTLRELDAPAVESTCPEELSALISGDHLQQILVNFVSNAVKYGDAPITVSARRDDGFVLITVADHGPGVPEEFAPRLFDRFSRAPSADGAAPQKGTGLGLSIVRGLAQAHDGDAWYEPNEPHGSRFNVRLPAG